MKNEKRKKQRRQRYRRYQKLVQRIFRQGHEPKDSCGAKGKGRAWRAIAVHVPYDYMKNPDNPKEWIIDEEAAQVVKKIFTPCMNGRGPSQIAEQLEHDKVLTPTAYKNKR